MADASWGGSGGSSVRDIWRRGLASLGALLLALLIGALLFYVAQSNSERDAAAERERNSFEVIMLARSIEGSIARSEAALGRYVINSDRALGTIYRDEWRSASRQIEQLDRLVRDNPRQSGLVRELERHFASYGEALAETASYATARRNWEALSLHNRAAGNAHGPAIDRTLEQIAENERGLLNERSSERFEAAERSNVLAMLLAIAGVVLAMLAVVLAWTAIRAFRERHTADARVDSLEAAVAARTAELEALNEELRIEAAERLAAEQQLRQVQKMEAVGQLTGGIAHDFNNMLAVVMGGLDLARRKLADGQAEVGVHLDHALDGAKRAAELTRRLLAFARAEPLLPEGTAPAALLEGMADLLHRTIGEQVEVSIEADPDAWTVWVDPHQLENALLNLAVNARDAMDGKGRLDIRVSNAALAAGEIGEAEPGDYVRIAVSDTGCGMTPEVMERVFEPFFTTKPVGKGTGLGLSQIFGFARQSGGEIGIESTPGEGTTVSLYLPRFDGEATVPRLSAGDWTGGTAAGAEQIAVLVVEDDERVRRATMGAIEELGHRPVSCGNGEAALDVLASREDIALLLTDIVMPGMTGIELATKAAELRPGLPMLFVTGYVGEASDAERLTGREVLRKPFTVAALARAIERTLGTGEDAAAARAASS